MRKNIDIDQMTLTKLKVLSAFEDLSVKALMEKAIRFFIEYKEQEKFKNMSLEEKEDLGLLLLMQQVDVNEIGTEEEFFNALDE